MKGLILCAGNGNRLKPFSQIKPKGLLPVVNKPIIHYCLEKLAELYMTEVGIVIKPEHRFLFVEEVGYGEKWNLSITYIEQQQALGIADAVKQSEFFLDRSPFILLLGDNLFVESLERLSHFIQVEGYEAAVILAAVKTPSDFGIAEVEGNQIVHLEEKPAKPKSNLALLGAYAFQPSIFEAIHKIPPSARGEYEITDAIQWMLNHQRKIAFCVTNQNYSDVGTLERWLEANRWMLDQQLAAGKLESFASDSLNHYIPPVCIDPGAELTNCIIGPYVTIGPGVKLSNCRLEDSIILEGTRLISPPLPITHAITRPGSSYMLDSKGESG
ncbi:sugar phosphate nucleotidyltransferase [Paenibacillus filicis]|uniref:Sugar phosphate nucleotidyltransferase n=1 Tax=Paenibacillus filicis TaxID=669464 RepID=A0ABU9DRH3_9BACL